MALEISSRLEGILFNGRKRPLENYVTRQMKSEFEAILISIQNTPNPYPFLVDESKLRDEFDRHIDLYREALRTGKSPYQDQSLRSKTLDEQYMQFIREWMQAKQREAQILAIEPMMDAHFEKLLQHYKACSEEIHIPFSYEEKMRLVQYAISYWRAVIEHGFAKGDVSYEDVHTWMTQENIFLTFLYDQRVDQLRSYLEVPERPREHLPGSGIELPVRS